jgi:hypothetical protein
VDATRHHVLVQQRGVEAVGRQFDPGDADLRCRIGKSQTDVWRASRTTPRLRSTSARARSKPPSTQSFASAAISKRMTGDVESSDSENAR